MLEDFRILAINDWLENDLLLKIISFEPASSDASFRRYFRVTTPDRKFIVMDAPPQQENISAFVKIAGLFSMAQIHVPAVLQQNLEEGFLLLEDFGSTVYLDFLNQDNADSLYQAAFDSLLKLQSTSSLLGHDLPQYDNYLLNKELSIFDEWFLGRLLETSFPGPIKKSLYDLLINAALEQPVTCVHRDFHSRNLMVLTDNSPGVLDFQDAVIGPITYDLVSLLRDCYIAWPEHLVESWLIEYYDRLLAHKLLACDLSQFQRWFDLMGMQRHLKAIGIFSRLHLRDGKPNYLKDIPRTLNYVCKQAQRYPELSDFNDYLNNSLLPIYNAIQ